ncbi:complement component C8 alpha chain [Aplochiton taeniatus]
MEFRFRYMEKASQFAGSKCAGTLWEEHACPDAQTVCLEPDYCGESFTCNETGRCISPSLLCNGEADCGDFSDEDTCGKLHPRDQKCSKLLAIPGANRGTQGFNVLSGDFALPVLDAKYYGGLCEYVYNGEWRKFTYDAFCENLRYSEDEKYYRKPYNYHAYRFLAQATSEGTSEYYEDLGSFLRARKEEGSSNFGASIGIAYVEVGISGSDEWKFVNNISQYNNQEVGFVRLVSKVQTATFRMRSDELMLDENMYTSLMELPEEYDFGRYSRFLKDYGTHYVTQGSMGGTLEYIAVLDKAAMAASHKTGEEIGGCLGASIGIAAPVKQVQVDLKGEIKGCEKVGSFSKEDTSSSSYIKDIYTLVKGGSTVSSGTLLGVRDPDTYRRWGKTLKHNPTLIEYETMPVYELLRLSTAADQVGERLSHLRRALDEYLLQFNPCRCAPCRHNGVPVLLGTSCHCSCKEGYGGEACEATSRPDKTTDGAWSCWGAWSACQSGGRTRIRACNNPPPDGGADCVGSSFQSQRC